MRFFKTIQPIKREASSRKVIIFCQFPLARVINIIHEIVSQNEKTV